MLRILDRPLSPDAALVLNDMQTLVDNEPDYASRVTRATALWKSKAGTEARKAAFATIKRELAAISYGVSRCAYCEDSAADEIEHIWPKSLFPQLTFQWSNYAFACGPCNGPKGNRFATVAAD